MDKAHKQTDLKLEEIEKRLTAIYKRANKEIVATADEYFKQFEKQDKEQLKLLSEGKITEKEYKLWRKNKMMTGKRYKDMKEQTAEQLLHINETALAYINGELPEIYALNYNYLAEAVDGVGGYSFTLTDADTIRNLAIADKTLLPYKYVNGTKDVRWNTKKVNAEVLQGILQGDSINKIADRLQRVTEMNRTSAIRNARTSVTSAECKGRQDSYSKASKDGIILKKCWMSTNDKRTRHWHADLNGVQVGVDESFYNDFGEIKYPADPHANPANVYNCRCTTVARVLGFVKAKVENAVENVEKTENEFSIFDNIIEKSDNPAEFWMNMDANQQSEFKKSGMKIADFYNKVKSKYVPIKKKEDLIWKPAAKGSTDDFKIKADFTKGNCSINKVRAKSDGWMADANDEGIINIRDDSLGDNWKSIICHEAGHQLSNMSPELARTIMLNPDDIFGRYNIKMQGFDGVFGEYSPEEAFATSVSYYYRNPEYLKKLYPKTFEAIDNLFKTSKGAREYVSKAVAAYKEAFNV